MSLVSVRGVCNFLGSVSSQQKFEAMDVKTLKTDHVSALGQISVTAQFYLENKGKYILEAQGQVNPKEEKRESKSESTCTRERSPQPLGSFNPM